MRAFTSLSIAHQKLLEKYMKQIEDWVYDSNSGEFLVLKVPSYSLKKALSKEVTKIYMGSGVFVEFNRQQQDTIVKKSKNFK